MGATWTAELEDELRRLQKQDLSASQIAGAMRAGLSRNSIIGKLHRMGLRPNSQVHRVGSERKPRGPRKARVNKQRILRARDAQHAERSQKAAELRAMFAAEEVIDLPPEDLSKAVTLLQLTAHTCRWPIGDPAKLDTFRFCGAEPHSKKPYCLRHCRMAYVRPTRPETRAAVA